MSYIHRWLILLSSTANKAGDSISMELDFSSLLQQHKDPAIKQMTTVTKKEAIPRMIVAVAIAGMLSFSTTVLFKLWPESRHHGTSHKALVLPRPV